jgi:hypothetical protein
MTQIHEPGAVYDGAVYDNKNGDVKVTNTQLSLLSITR